MKVVAGMGSWQWHREENVLLPIACISAYVLLSLVPIFPRRTCEKVAAILDRATPAFDRYMREQVICDPDAGRGLEESNVTKGYGA